jgi:hypothetical protein
MFGLRGAIALAFDYLVGFTFGVDKLRPCKTDTFNKYTLRMSYEALRRLIDSIMDKAINNV